MIETRTRVLLRTGARCGGKSARGGRGWVDLGAGASDRDNGTGATLDCDDMGTALDSADAKRAGRRTLR